jgi:cell division protein FtsB
MQRHSFLGYVLSLLLMIGSMWLYVQYRDLSGQYAKYVESERAVQDLRKQVETARELEGRLQRSVADMDKDPVEWEAAIRRHKGLVREGEKIYRIESAL